MACNISDTTLLSWIDTSQPAQEAHLAACPACRERASQMRAQIAALASDAEPVPPLPATIGQYTIRRAIAAGGQGLIYEAEQEQTRRIVAVKVLRGGGCVNEDERRRFRLEIRALAALQHPAIATIYEAGCTAEGRHFFAMEFVQGAPLDKYAREHELALPEKLALFAEVCDGVRYAHGHGIVHRDLKPGNILVDAEGKPKILDFGLAKVAAADVTCTLPATISGQVLGTPRYMSPEQTHGRPEEVDARTDVYSLGVVLYELIAGRPPYDVARAWPEAVTAICEREPQRLGSLSRAWRGDLETIVRKALEKEPTRRYASAGDLAEDLRRYLANEPILALPPSRFYAVRRKVAKHRLALGLAAAVILLTVGGVAMTLTARHRLRQFQGNSTVLDLERCLRHGEYELVRDLAQQYVADPALGGNMAQLQASASLCLREYEAAVNGASMAIRFYAPEPVPFTHYHRATALWAAGRRQEAAADYRFFLQLSPDHLYAAARLFLVLRDEARALESLNRHDEAQQAVHEADEVLARARERAERGSWIADVLDCLALKLCPADLVSRSRSKDHEERCEAYYYAAEACLLADRVAEAQPLFDACVRNGPVFDSKALGVIPMNEWHLARWRCDQLAADANVTSALSGG